MQSFLTNSPHQWLRTVLLWWVLPALDRHQHAIVPVFGNIACLALRTRLKLAHSNLLTLVGVQAQELDAPAPHTRTHTDRHKGCVDAVQLLKDEIKPIACAMRMWLYMSQTTETQKQSAVTADCSDSGGNAEKAA